MMQNYYVYILVSKKNGLLYIGMTSDLIKRAWQHREGVVEGYTKQKSIKRLVYFETYQDAEQAILREKRLKRWRRAWKNELIEEKNAEWNDLYKQLL